MMDERERVSRQPNRLKTAILLVGLLIFLGILSGAPAYAYLIGLPVVAVAGYFGLKESELNKED